MTGIQALAEAYGVRIELADLGDWGRVRLIAEYDPQGPVIRVNTRDSSLTLRQAQGDMGADQAFRIASTSRMKSGMTGPQSSDAIFPSDSCTPSSHRSTF